MTLLRIPPGGAVKFVRASSMTPTLIAGLALAWGCTAALDTTTPAETASDASCERLADHLVALIDHELRSTGSVGASSAASGQRRALLRACLQFGDAVTVGCLLRARDLEEAERCDDLDARPQSS